jgi:hypothetical protein
LKSAARGSEEKKALEAKYSEHQIAKAQAIELRKEQDIEMERARANMIQSLQFFGAGQERSALRSTERAVGRRGLAFSGLEQAALGDIREQFALNRVQTMGDFENRLSTLAAQEAANFRAGEFDFLRNLSQMGLKQNFDRALLEFQMRMQQDIQKSSAWGQVWGGVMQAIGTMGGMGFAALI